MGKRVMLTSEKTLSRRAEENRIVHNIRNDDFWREVRKALEVIGCKLVNDPNAGHPLAVLL
jgi:hypothetical protein